MGSLTRSHMRFDAKWMNAMLRQSIAGHDPERSKCGVPIAFRRQKDEGPVEPYYLGEGIDLHHGTPALIAHLFHRQSRD